MKKITRCSKTIAVANAIVSNGLLLILMLVATLSHATQEHRQGLIDTAKAAVFAQNPRVTPTQLTTFITALERSNKLLLGGANNLKRKNAAINSLQDAGRLMSEIATLEQQVAVEVGRSAGVMCATFPYTLGSMIIGTSGDIHAESRSQVPMLSFTFLPRDLIHLPDILATNITEENDSEAIIVGVNVENPINNLIETIRSTSFLRTGQFNAEARAELRELANRLRDSLNTFDLTSYESVQNWRLKNGNHLLRIAKLIEESDFDGTTIDELLNKGEQP